MMRALLNTPSEYLRGITLERLDAEHSIPLNMNGLPFAEGGFKTPSGKFEFGACSLGYSAAVESRRGDAALLKKFPLELISSKNEDGMNSTFGYRPAVQAQTTRLSIHPSDARARAISPGGRVKVFNERGTCYFTAHLTEDVLPGVLRAPSVGWQSASGERLGINHLTSERLTDIGGGPTFFSCLVDVLPA
jgi:anaerobic selenocysteine-containing dehydrogenase